MSEDTLKLAQERIRKNADISYYSNLEIECGNLAAAYIDLHERMGRIAETAVAIYEVTGLDAAQRILALTKGKSE